jgi:hypothetical protein
VDTAGVDVGDGGAMKRKRMPPVIKCPDCGKLIAIQFPVHDCSPWLPDDERAANMAALKEKYG